MAKTTVQYVALAPHSYHYCEYDDTDHWGSSGYTYVRKPDPTDRTRYADRPVTHIEVRPDVEVLYNGADGASVTWDPDMPCPFVRLDEARKAPSRESRDRRTQHPARRSRA